MVCEPTVRLDVLNVADPSESSVPLPSEVPLSLKSTFPVATVRPPVTDAVKVTELANEDGLMFDETDIPVWQTPLCACTSVNGEFANPEVVMLRTSTPVAKP
jgi:hypothetical protein